MIRVCLSVLLVEDVEEMSTGITIWQSKVSYRKYTVHFFNIVIFSDVSSPSFVDTNLNNEVIEKEYNSQFELRCFINGRPTPSLSWYRDDKEIVTKVDSGIRAEDRGQRLIFSRLLGKDSGVYECRAGNRAGSIARRTLLKVKGTDGYEDTLQPSEVVVIFFLVFIGFTMLLMALCIGKRNQEAKVIKFGFSALWY